ncbi:MAG TPA: MTH1187 family thiamine-binding protein [Spirochaetota bacterium]|nr:MTH1187 family thiamine-binding protein [Spirochaetota bacterium]HPI89855.1 MTH1187 family thiamine-binding protein [Spirochaetota bacterium]HPR48632.1 MTH1187 family thiamine-binding protein [Spirochaetota bacterium]
MSALAELTIFPIGKHESLSIYVARAVKIIAESGLEYTVGPMGTVIEGPWPRVMETVSACMKDMQGDSNRIYMVLKVDWRNEPEGRITRKTDSVFEKINA